MNFRYFYILIIFFASLPTFAQTYNVNDFSSLEFAISNARTIPNENHVININGNIQFESSISESISFELINNDLENRYNLDLNGFNITYLGSDKTSKISNLNIIESNSNSSIVNRNQTLTINNSTLTGHSNFGKELVKNINGSLLVNDTSFSNNYAEKGAGINFSGNILNIKSSEFINNKAFYGGAIYLNNGNVDISKSKFNKNTSSSGGGALFISTNSTVVLDNTSFLENFVSTGSTGGAIQNNGNLVIRNNSVFSNNQVVLGSGGAISNSGTLNIDKTIFENNLSKNDGGAITSTGNVTVTNSTFRGNTSTEYFGGAVACIKKLIVDNCVFENNSSYTFGGAIASLQGDATISNTKFMNNSAKTSFGGGAIINYLGTLDLKGTNLFENNLSETNGGAISTTTNSTTNISSGTNFINNSAKGLGGGIFSQGTININADNSELPILFSGNTDSNGSNAIHLDIYTNQPIGIGTLNVNVSNGSSVIFDDNISGVENTVVNIDGTSSKNDKVYFGASNENLNSNVNTKNISLEFYNEISGMQNAVITAENTHFNFMNGFVSQNKLNLNLVGNENSFSIDVDPENLTCDYFELSNNRSSMNNITIRDINVISNPKQSTTIFDIFDHDRYGTNITLSDKLKNQVVYGSLKKYVWALTPKLTLIEIAGFNPNIQRYQVATASTFMNQILSYEYSLNRTDEIYSNLREAKLAQRKLNSYAYTGRSGTYVEQHYEDNSTLWIRPYVNLESFHLSGAVSSVHNQSYGTMLGFDFPMQKTRNNWKLFSTIYGAYIGSTQQFEDSNIYQNGGYIGYLLSAFKDNFYLGWTINGGGLNIENQYLRGNDNYATVTAGTALKLVYNLKFRKFLIQPNVVTSYTFLKPMDLVNFQSVDLNQSQVNGLTVSPLIRIIYRNESGFEPYIFAGCTIPIMSDIKLRANDIHLNKLNLNTWAQFGAGVRRHIGERVTCFAESIIRTGGRIGWGFMFNIQIAL